MIVQFSQKLLFMPGSVAQPTQRLFFVLIFEKSSVSINNAIQANSRTSKTSQQEYVDTSGIPTSITDDKKIAMQQKGLLQHSKLFVFQLSSLVVIGTLTQHTLLLNWMHFLFSLPLNPSVVGNYNRMLIYAVPILTLLLPRSHD